jgi:hypothetical protein
MAFTLSQVTADGAPAAEARERPKPPRPLSVSVYHRRRRAEIRADDNVEGPGPTRGRDSGHNGAACGPIGGFLRAASAQTAGFRYDGGNLGGGGIAGG